MRAPSTAADVFSAPWTGYAHGPSSCWSRESYVRLGTMSDCVQFWKMIHATGEHAGNVHLFLSRGDLFPDYDSGAFAGYVSLLVRHGVAARFWQDMAGAAVVGGAESPVAAVSMSPRKRDHCVAKIWLLSPPGGAGVEAMLRQYAFPLYYAETPRYEAKRAH